MIAKADLNIEAVKTKSSEKLFFKYLSRKLNGIGIPKITPFKGQYIDLLYIENKKAALFKFMDTNEETFSILSDEIVEIIEEEHQSVEEFLEKRLDGITISYYFVMPYVELSRHGKTSGVIIDKLEFEELINDEKNFDELLSPISTDVEHFLFKMAKEYFVFQKEKMTGDFFVDLEYGKENIQAVLMEKEQIEAVNSLHYGTTLLEAPTGCGKTSIMFSKAIKLARTYPNDHFLYITFNKQLSNEIKNRMKYYYPDIMNIRVINFHQFVLLLGKKYNLKLNKQSRQSFNKEFEKVFEKVAKIYKGKRHFKGVFVDEAENFSYNEIEFLREVSYKTKNVLYISYDEPKRMTPIPENLEGANRYPWDHRLTLSQNYRASRAVAQFNLDFQNDINAFSALELDRVNNYFKTFTSASKMEGKSQIFEYETTDEMQSQILDVVHSCLQKGYAYSDIGIIYPYNEKIKGSQNVQSKQMLKNWMEEEGVDVSFVDDESGNLKRANGITLTNIYNCTNLQWKVVILCQLDILYAEINPENLKRKDIQKMLNIIYTASGRANEELYVMLKKDDQRPGVIDLLGQKVL